MHTSMYVMQSRHNSQAAQFGLISAVSSQVRSLYGGRAMSLELRGASRDFLITKQTKINVSVPCRSLVRAVGLRAK